MDASTSQDVFDLIIPAKCPKTFSGSNSSTVSEQLHLLTTQVDQFRVTSEQTLEQTKPLIQTFQHKTVPISSRSSAPSGSVLYKSQ